MRPHRAAALLALSTALTAPAWAGSAADPEVRAEDCRPGDVNVAGDHVVCAGWFAAAGPTGATTLTTTVQVAGDLEARRVPTRVQLGWDRADGCRERWSVDDTVDAGTQVSLARSCPGAPRVEVVLPSDRAVVRGRTVQVELTGADFASVGSALRPGDLLSAPVAGSALLVRSATDLGGELSTGLNSTPPGRTFAVPPAEA